MGLITKEVELGINARNIKNLESKGYNIPREKDKRGAMRIPRGTKIKVKIEDLTDDCHALINVKCDCRDCITPILKPIIWSNYKNSIKDDGKYYCKKCSINLFANENARKTKLMKSKSLKKWCLENNKQDILERWDYLLNKYKPEEVSFSTNKKFYFKCPKGIHKSELKDIKDFTDGRVGAINCKACNSFAQSIIDLYGKNALELYWDYDKNNKLNINPWNIDKSSSKKVYIKCQEKDYHGSYYIYCHSFAKGNRCSYCTNNRGIVHLLDSLGTLFPQVLDIWANNKKSPYEYAPKSDKKVWWKCPEGIHKDYKRKISGSNVSYFRCPECSGYSKGEDKLEDILIIKNIEYTPQKTFKGLLGLKNGKLSYDFYLPKYNILIEYQGEQHERPIDFKGKGKKYAEKQFKIQQEHDKRKKEYAKNNNIQLLEIWYYDFDNIEQILIKELNLKVGGD